MQHIKSILIISVFFIAQSLNAQTVKENIPINTDSINFFKVESEAEYTGGLTAWRKYLEKKLNPDVAFNNNAPIGKYAATVLFVVDKDGSLSDIKSVTNFGYGMEEEVKRVIALSGKWIPAIQNGKPVRAYRKQPVTFLLDSDEFSIATKTPYTLYSNADNEIEVTVRKLDRALISLNATGANITALQDGKFIININKPGRIIIEVVNTKNNKQIGLASFEVQ